MPKAKSAGNRPGAGTGQASLDFEQVCATAASYLRAWTPAAWPVHPDWQPLIDDFMRSPQGRSLGAFIDGRLQAGACIYPAQPLRALELTPLASVKVVILGQDPYHGPGQAHGLAFSVPAGVRPPPSLRNILVEVFRETGETLESRRANQTATQQGVLESWAEQGVLLLNTSLTVEEGAPASHARRGWESLTDQLIQAVASHHPGVVFMLWGAHAQAKRSLIEGDHLVLTANHPSPLSARRAPQPFIGCGHFNCANQWLEEHGRKAICWTAFALKTVA